MSRCCKPSQIADFRTVIRQKLAAFSDEGRPHTSAELTQIHTAVIELFLEDGFCAEHAGKIAADVMTQVRVKCGTALESR